MDVRNNYLEFTRSSLFVLVLVFYSSFSVSSPVLVAESEGMKYQVVLVKEGLGVPWGLAFINDHQLLVTERRGRIIRLDVNTGRVDVIQGGPKVRKKGQGGLLDVKVGPFYPKQGWIYFTYSKKIKGEGATTLARAWLKADKLMDWQDLLVTRSADDSGRHFGSRIAFDRNGHLFFSVGDRGHRPNGQDLQTHAGSILRVNLDGSTPSDNPFVLSNTSSQSADASKQALPEIWSYGHRNPQGIAYDGQTEQLWAIEHGPRGGDEINLIQAGKNYGWPVISYGKEYWGPIQVGEGSEKEGLEQPIKYYVPSIAPSSLLIYSGKAFPKWKGNLMAGALKLMHINRVILNSKNQAIKEERLLGALNVRVRALIEGSLGEIFFSTDNGAIFKIIPIT